MAKSKLLKDLKDMSLADLQKKTMSLYEESFRLRCEHHLGQLTNKLQLRHTRRDLARAKTILTAREKNK